MSKTYRGLKGIRILTDNEEENPTDSFENISKKIAGMILESPPQYTVGIHGDWGTGKTTMMKSIERKFFENEEEWIPSVWFNAWRYEREDEKATIPLILTILEKLAYTVKMSEDKKDWYDRQKKKLSKYVRGWKANLSIPITFVNLDLSFEGNEDETTNIPKPNIQEGLDMIKEFCTQIKHEELENDLKMVVFIDDLDRCSPKKALEVLESIKILLDIKGLVYVVGLSDKTINKLISSYYKESKINGKSYLEKIIQIPTNVPNWESTDFEKLIEKNIKPFIDGKYMSILEGKEELLYLAVGENPRQLKRLINNIILSVEIYGGKEGINEESLLSVELMRTIWPQIYNEFSIRQSFRDMVNQNIDEPVRFKTFTELQKKSRDETQILNVDEKRFLEIEDDFWKFMNKIKNSLYEISDWKLYRNVSALAKDISDSKSESSFGSSSLLTLRGHTGSVRGVSVLPDGKIVSGSYDDTVRVWDTATGELVQTLEGHGGTVMCVSVLPDGKIVSGSYDKTVRVWDTATGELVQTLEGHHERVMGVAILPDGKIVSGSFDKTVRVWDTATGELVQTLEGHTGEVVGVAILPDGKIVSGSFDKTVRVWDTATGELVQTLEGHTGEVRTVSVLPDGKIVSGSKDNTVRVWDTATGELVQTLEGHTGEVMGIAILPDGKIVSGSEDKTVRVWDTATGELVQTLEGHTDEVWTVSVLPDGKIVSGSKDNTVRVW